MNRRSVLKSGFYITGYSFLMAGGLSTISSCRSTPQLEWQPSFLTVDEAAIVDAVSRAIIPTTDTPGAAEAGVAQFIDDNVKNNLTTEQQGLFREGLQLFDEIAQESHGKKFNQLSAEQAHAVLLNIEDSIEEGKGPHIFSVMKDMTKFGYFTSEVGQKEFLVFDPLPSVYHGCIDVSEVGGTWAI